MSLADLTVEQREVTVKGGSFVVKGLTLESLTVLVRTHLPDLEKLFDLFVQNEKLQDGDIERLALAALEEAPGFVSNVIALAAGEPDQAPKVNMLPIDVQFKALTDIAEMTFGEVGSVGKLLEKVVAMLGKNDLTKLKKSMQMKKTP